MVRAGSCANPEPGTGVHVGFEPGAVYWFDWEAPHRVAP